MLELAPNNVPHYMPSAFFALVNMSHAAKLNLLIILFYLN